MCVVTFCFLFAVTNILQRPWYFQIRYNAYFQHHDSFNLVYNSFYQFSPNINTEKRLFHFIQPLSNKNPPNPPNQANFYTELKNNHSIKSTNNLSYTVNQIPYPNITNNELAKNLTFESNACHDIKYSLTTKISLNSLAS